jgi:hypothetical protein
MTRTQALAQLVPHVHPKCVHCGKAATRVATLPFQLVWNFCDECNFLKWPRESQEVFVENNPEIPWPPKATWEDLPHAEAVRLAYDILKYKELNHV